MADEQRQYDIFGEKFLIETNTDRYSKPGKAAYFLQSQTTDGVKYNQSLHEGSGLSRIHAGKTLQIDVGGANEDGVNSLIMTAHKGNASINADGGKLLLKADEIVLEAKNGLYLGGSNVQVGFAQMGRTDQVEITGQSVNVTTRGGNIGDLLKTSNIFQAFAGSYVQSTVAAGVAKGVGKFFG
jgi:hypothetical protein